MASDTTNRQVSREAFAELLKTALVGTSLPAALVLSYKPDTIEVTPLVMVLNGGAGRLQAGVGTTKNRNLFVFEVHTLIRDTDDSGLTDQQREQRADWIEKKISDVIGDNRSTANWDMLYRDGERQNTLIPSKVSAAIIDGKAYLLEVFNVEVFVND